MQTTSALYKQIIADENHSFEVKLDIAGTEYGMDVIFSARGTAKTFETEPTIGGVYSATLDFSLLTDGASIPRMAKVIPYFRATDGARTSEWIKKGEFYIDVRSVTSNGDGLSVFKAQCFDGMLKANAPYANSSLSWPATDTAVVAEICTALGFTQDARNAGIMTAGYSIPSAPVDLTYRDVLSYIAAMYGANWIMTDAGELLLLPLGEGTDTLTVGNNVQNLNVSPKRNGYTKVILETSEGVAVESGASDAVAITAFCPYATQAISDAVLTALSSFEYQPFGAVGVWADPAVEIGDNMSAVTTTGTVFSREIEFGTGMVMNLSAPNDNYTDHEYSYESPTERRYKRSIGGLRSEISIQEGKISLVVSETSGGNVVNAASIVTAINGSSSSVIISADKINLDGYVTVTDLSTQGQTVINGANITTGIIQDSQNKNYWNLQTGEFIIRNGKINISTGSSTDDYIVLDGNTTQTHVSSRYLGVWNKSNDANPNTRIQIAGAAINMQSSSDGTNWVRRALISDDYMWHFSDTGKPVSKIGAYSSSSPFGQIYLYDQDGNLRQYQDYSGIKFADTSGNLTNFVAPNGIWFPLGDIPYSAAITAIVNKVLDQPGDGVWQIAGTWTNHVNGYSGIVSMQSYGSAWSASKILFGIIATSSATNGGVWAWSGLSGAGIYIWPLHT